MHRDAVVRLLAALEVDDVEYVLVGGVAVNLHGIVRATEDVDPFVRPEDKVSRLRTALRRLHDDAEIATITAADLAGEYPVVRYVPPGEGVPVDLIARLGSASHARHAELERGWSRRSGEALTVGTGRPPRIPRRPAVFAPSPAVR
jgi:hypothetical protein